MSLISGPIGGMIRTVPQCLSHVKFKVTVDTMRFIVRWHVDTLQYNWDILNKVLVTLYNDLLPSAEQFFHDFHEWKSHKWKSLPNHLTSNKTLLYFLNAISCPEHTNPLKIIISHPFHHCCLGRPFLNKHNDVTKVDLWYHMNMSYWNCYIIFNCFCTCKLAQRRSSLINNNHEYWFPPSGIHGIAYKSIYHVIYIKLFISIQYIWHMVWVYTDIDLNV